VRLVRDSGRVLNGVPQLVGRPEGEPHGRQTSAAYGRAESPDFLPARFCGGSASRGAVCRAASVMWATHLWLGLKVLQCMDHEELSHLSQRKILNRPKEMNAVSTPTPTVKAVPSVKYERPKNYACPLGAADGLQGQQALSGKILKRPVWSLILYTR